MSRSENPFSPGDHLKASETRRISLSYFAFCIVIGVAVLNVGLQAYGAYLSWNDVLWLESNEEGTRFGFAWFLAGVSLVASIAVVARFVAAPYIMFPMIVIYFGILVHTFAGLFFGRDDQERLLPAPVLHGALAVPYLYAWLLVFLHTFALRLPAPFEWWNHLHRLSDDYRLIAYGGARRANGIAVSLLLFAAICLRIVTAFILYAERAELPDAYLVAGALVLGGGWLGDILMLMRLRIGAYVALCAWASSFALFANIYVVLIAFPWMIIVEVLAGDAAMLENAPDDWRLILAVIFASQAVFFGSLIGIVEFLRRQLRPADAA